MTGKATNGYHDIARQRRIISRRGALRDWLNIASITPYAMTLCIGGAAIGLTMARRRTTSSTYHAIIIICNQRKAIVSIRMPSARRNAAICRCKESELRNARCQAFIETAQRYAHVSSVEQLTLKARCERRDFAALARRCEICHGEYRPSSCASK